MNELAFVEKFRTDSPQLKAMGLFVQEKLKQELSSEISDLDEFLKISPNPRLKDEQSLLGKAFHRGKNYHNPYEDITDKVGIRFVVLTLSDVRLVCEKIKDIKEWEASLDKDFESDREQNPHVFDYQSMHYVVKLNKNVTHNQILIEKGICCEIQIRTLMQHAYSELSHGVLYKPKSQISQKTTRTLTRSVALIEAVDDYFTEASKGINSEFSLVENSLNDLNKVFKNVINVHLECDRKTNIFLLSHFECLLNGINYKELSDYFFDNSHITEAIKLKVVDNYFYRQPIILLLYYLIGKKINLSRLREIWPLDQGMIKPIFTDFGDSIDRYN